MELLRLALVDGNTAKPLSRRVSDLRLCPCFALSFTAALVAKRGTVFKK